jgi:uncharacterized membrane protein
MMGMDMGFSLLGVLLMLLLWVGLIALAVWLLGALFPRESRRKRLQNGHDLSGQEILDMRYARGEITREQYQLMREDLSK